MDDRNDYYKSLFRKGYIELVQDIIDKFCLDHKGCVVAKENGFDNLLKDFAEKVKALNV